MGYSVGMNIRPFTPEEERLIARQEQHNRATAEFERKLALLNAASESFEDKKLRWAREDSEKVDELRLSQPQSFSWFGIGFGF
jgi:hypothetical protein